MFVASDVLIQAYDKKTSYPDNNSIPRILPLLYEENPDWLKEVTFTANKGIVEAVESMEERVFSASMQVKVLIPKFIVCLSVFMFGCLSVCLWQLMWLIVADRVATEEYLIWLIVADRVATEEYLIWLIVADRVATEE